MNSYKNFIQYLKRISLIFLLAGMFTSVFAENAAGQKISLNITNKTVKEIINEIENQTEFKFIYNSQLVDVTENRTINVKNNNISKVLKKLFSDSDVNYKIVDNKIVLSSRKAMSKPGKVTGKVTDSKGESLPGVSVMEKDTDNGVVTDANGIYTIDVKDVNGTLIFSFVGMTSQEISISQRATLNVVLEDGMTGLDEVVVVGYGTQKRANLTGAITAVGVKEISSIPSSNLSNSLAGRAPGVTIVNESGLSGAGSTIRIRGGFGKPLFVIDGVVSEKSDFDALDASEIENLSFLKDAATASIYGSRAGNGVVLVTTRNGETQKPMFTYQGSYSTSRPTQKLLSDLTDATDELIYQNRVAEFRGNALPNGDDEFEYFKNRNYNVHDFIWQDPFVKKHSLSVSGGSDKIKYFSLISFRDEEGSYKNLDHETYNIRSNVQAKITEDITMQLNLSANQKSHDRFFWPFAGDEENHVADLYRVTFNWPKLYPFYTDKDGNPANEVTEFPVSTPIGSWQAWNVIDQIIGNRYIRLRERNVHANLELNIDLKKFLPGLTTKFKGNYSAHDYMKKRFLTHQHNYQFIPADPNNNRYIPGKPDPSRINTFNFSQDENLYYQLRTKWSYQVNWFLNYKKKFGKHAVDAMTVFEQAENGGYGAYAQLKDPITEYDQSFVYSGDSEMRNGNGWEYQGARQSYIGRFNYNFDDKYIIEYSFRYDGNTKFPTNGRWGYFPSYSAAWRLSQENFMQFASSWLDDFKLRASYGTTGNDLNTANSEIAYFLYENNYKNGNSYIFGDKLYRGIRPGGTPNPDLTWATVTTFNAGADFAFLKNRLTGSIDIFNKKETDILGSRIVTIPNTYGQSLAPENYAARSWKGGELSLVWRDKALDGEITYSVHGNLGYSKDQWDTYDESENYKPGGNRHWASRIGQPLNRLFGFKCIGMVRTQEQLDELKSKGYKTFGRDPYLGGLIYEDIRGDGYDPNPDGKIDMNDWQMLSDNAVPRINYGFGFKVEWKGISVDAHFQGVGMYDRMISNKEGGGMRQWGGTVRPYYPIWAGDVWTPETPDAKYPRPIGYNWAESGAIASDFWMRNGSYLRLKNLNVGYKLPKKYVSIVGLEEAQLYMNATNLFAISEMTEFHDPEQRNYDSYPLMKTFTFGLQIKF